MSRRRKALLKGVEEEEAWWVDVWCDEFNFFFFNLMVVILISLI